MPKVNTPPKKQLTIRMDGDIIDRLEQYAQKSRIPKSIHLQLAINEYLDNKNAPWPVETELENE